MTDANATQDHNHRRDTFESRVRSTRRLRLVLMTGGLIIGSVLIMNGQTLIGVLIAGFTIVRLMAVFGLGLGLGRRAPLGRRATRMPSDASVQARQWLRGHARDEFTVAATAIGVPSSELRDAFQQGQSIAEIATAHTRDVDTVINAIDTDLTARLHQAVSDDTVSEHDARDIETITHRWAARLVHGHRGEFRQTPDSQPRS
jgi:hypothetical protein